jgi:hypothetical protein
MKTISQLLACICLGLSVQSAGAAFASGQDLLDGFKAVSRVGTADQRPIDQLLAGRISGYVQGVIDSGVSAGLLCTYGKGVTLRTAQPVIVEYLEKNPKMLTQAAVEAVMLSLHPKYKCN